MEGCETNIISRQGDEEDLNLEDSDMMMRNFGDLPTRWTDNLLYNFYHKQQHEGDLLIQKKIDLRISGQLSKEQELQNEIEKIHASTNEALENSWDIIIFTQNQNHTIRKKIAEHEGVDIVDLENHDQTSKGSVKLIKGKDLSDRTQMTSALSNSGDDSLFENFTKLSEIEKELEDEITQLKISMGKALDDSFDILQSVQIKNKELCKRIAEIELCEIDQSKQDIIAQNLRQLKNHCMNHGKIRRKILIVDDSCSTRKRIARAFEKAHFIVDTAENGREGLEKMKNSIYDIAFMDIEMPVMNGFDATKGLRAWEDINRPGTRQPICALTAGNELMNFKEAGLDVMESKPCNLPRLFKVVDDVSPMLIRRKILIVDDSCVVRKRVARAFEKAHFIVDTAENGREGLEKMKNSIYNITFMDIEMPVMNGFDATKALRVWENINRAGSRQPICALTAGSELMKFKEAGLDVMESKPFNFPRLFKVVDDHFPMFSNLSINYDTATRKK